MLRSLLYEIGIWDPLTFGAIALWLLVFVIATRLAWVFTVPYAIRAIDRRPSQLARRTSWRVRAVVGCRAERAAVHVLDVALTRLRDELQKAWKR